MAIKVSQNLVQIYVGGMKGADPRTQWYIRTAVPSFASHTLTVKGVTCDTIVCSQQGHRYDSLFLSR